MERELERNADLQAKRIEDLNETIQDNSKIQEKRIADLHQAIQRQGWFVGLGIALLAVLLTVLVVFFALRTEHAAVATAIEQVKVPVDEAEAARKRSEEILAEVRHSRQQANEIVAVMASRNASREAASQPLTSEELKASENLAAKRPKDRSAEDWAALGFSHFHEGRLEDATRSFDIASVLADNDLVIARNLFNKGATLVQMDQTENAIAAYEEIKQRFAASQEPTLRFWVARSLVSIGFRLGQLDRFEDAISAYDEVGRLYADAEELDIRKWVAAALVNKGECLRILGQLIKAAPIFDEVIDRYGNEPGAIFRESVVEALVNKARVLHEQGNDGAAVNLLQTVIDDYSPDENPEIAKLIEHAQELLDKWGGG